MSNWDILIGGDLCKPLLALFFDAYVQLLELDLASRDTIFQDFLLNDKLAADLYAFLNESKAAVEHTQAYEIRKGLFLLDSLSKHEILEKCKDIDYRGLYMLSDYFGEEYMPKVLNLEESISPEDLKQLKSTLLEDLKLIKAFIKTR